MSSNATASIAGLRELEDEAIAHHKRVADALEGCRLLLHGAIVERYGKVYQIVSLRAHRGIVKCYGVRIYDGKVGSRGYDLGDFRDCKVTKYADRGDTLPTHQPRPAKNLMWHPSHHSPDQGKIP